MFAFPLRYSCPEGILLKKNFFLLTFIFTALWGLTLPAYNILVLKPKIIEALEKDQAGPRKSLAMQRMLQEAKKIMGFQ